MLRKIRFFDVIRCLPFISLLLAACSLTPPPFQPSVETPQWQAHRASLAQITQYQARGSFAYFADQKKVYARFFWQQYSPDHYRLLLTNPLGGTELELNVKPDLIQVTDNKGQHYYSQDLQDTLQKLSGMALPLESMRFWLLGSPGDSKQFQLNSDHLVQQLMYRVDSQDWHVIYQGYHTDMDIPLPKQLELTQGALRIKLKIDSWTL